MSRVRAPRRQALQQSLSGYDGSRLPPSGKAAAGAQGAPPRDGLGRAERSSDAMHERVSGARCRALADTSVIDGARPFECGGSTPTPNQRPCTCLFPAFVGSLLQLNFSSCRVGMVLGTFLSQVLCCTFCRPCRTSNATSESVGCDPCVYVSVIFDQLSRGSARPVARKQKLERE